MIKANVKKKKLHNYKICYQKIVIVKATSNCYWNRIHKIKVVMCNENKPLDHTV